MNVTIKPTTPNGKIKAIASKSAAHRALICAAFANERTEIVCENTNEDIDATVRCLCALGAKITRQNASFIVSPVKSPALSHTLDAGESGSTLRFLLPVVCALGCGATFKMSGRLPERPLSPLRELLVANGASIVNTCKDTLTVSGRISAGEYRIRGDVSSQFISGLLFALSLTAGESRILLDSAIESAPYINMTLKTLYDFGADISIDQWGFTVKGVSAFTSPKNLTVEGDWSNATFMLAAGAVARGGNVGVTSLDAESLQGDRAIIELLVRFGADIRRKGDRITVRSGELYGIDIDATNIPDLVPILAVIATAANGRTVIRGAARLKLKESDRLTTTAEMLRTLGASIAKTEDGLIIDGGKPLSGGAVSSYGDHRIAMSAAIAALLSEDDVTVTEAEAVAKSYPAFWDDLASLGVTVDKIGFVLK